MTFVLTRFEVHIQIQNSCKILSTPWESVSDIREKILSMRIDYNNQSHDRGSDSSDPVTASLHTRIAKALTSCTLVLLI